MSYDEAVQQHIAGGFGDALGQRLAELSTLDPAHPRRPGVLGTIALDFERLENYDDALRYAEEAYRHAIPRRESEADERIREAEAPSVGINVGTVFLRAAARARLAGVGIAGDFQDVATEMLESAWAGIKAQRQPGKVHQWGINVGGRLAMDRAVEKRRFSALGLAAGAAAVSVASETPWLAHHTSGLPVRRQGGPKVKALGRGIGAFGVIALSLPGMNRWQRAAQARDRLILRFA